MKNNRYKEENAAFKINGYILSGPFPNIRAEFELAKTETIKNLKQDIQDIEDLTFEKYLYYNK